MCAYPVLLYFKRFHYKLNDCSKFYLNETKGQQLMYISALFFWFTVCNVLVQHVLVAVKSLVQSDRQAKPSGKCLAIFSLVSIQLSPTLFISFEYIWVEQLSEKVWVKPLWICGNFVANWTINKKALWGTTVLILWKLVPNYLCRPWELNLI